MLWLLLRVRWRRALASSIAVAMLIAGVGGFVLASAAAAHRVENAYRRFATQIDAPDLALIPASSCGPTDGTGCGSSSTRLNPDEVLATIRGLDVVEKARLVVSVIPFVTDVEGAPIFGTVDDVNGCYDGDRSVQLVAATNGGPKVQVIPFTLDGEMPTAGSGTVVITRSTANRVGLSIGDEIFLAGRCSNDGDPIVFATPIKLRISGLSIGPLDVDSPATGLTIRPAYVDPVSFAALLADGAEPQQNFAVWLDPTASAGSVEAALSAYNVMIDFRDRQSAFDGALKTDANLLWLLAAVGALGGLLVLAPVIGRNMRDTGPNTETLAALGTERQQIAHQANAHSCALAVLGALTAAVVAIPISAWMPNGLASEINPRREYWFDGLFTVIGVAILIVVVMLIGAIPAWRIGRTKRLPFAVESRSRRGVFGSLGLRPAARTGVAAAVGAPAGPRKSSPWPTLLSMVVAAVVGVASLTYLAGLRHLERTPALVGWNWDAVVSFDFFDLSDTSKSDDVFAAVKKLDAVEQVTGGTFYPPRFLYVPGADISVWPWSFATGPDAVQPATLSGRAPEGPDEVAIDAQFARATGLGIGDTVTLGRSALVTLMAQELTQNADQFGLVYEVAEPPVQTPVTAEFEITGIALLPGDPAQEISEVTLTLEGLVNLVEPSAAEVAATRAWLPADLLSPLKGVAERLLANLDIEGRVVYVRFSGDVYAGAQAIAGMDIFTELFGERDGSDGPPLQIVAPTPDQVLTLVVGLNIERNDRVPVALVIMVSVAFFALAAYLLFVSIRARRFEMAVMRALGLSTRGIHWSVAAQATASAVVAVVIAIPVGVVIGRLAWLAYARELSVQPVAVIPWSTLVTIAVATIAIANAIAIVPGWIATRRSPGDDLRSE